MIRERSGTIAKDSPPSSEAFDPTDQGDPPLSSEGEGSPISRRPHLRITSTWGKRSRWVSGSENYSLLSEYRCPCFFEGVDMPIKRTTPRGNDHEGLTSRKETPFRLRVRNTSSPSVKNQRIKIVPRTSEG